MSQPLHSSQHYHGDNPGSDGQQPLRAVDRHYVEELPERPQDRPLAMPTAKASTDAAPMSVRTSRANAVGTEVRSPARRAVTCHAARASSPRASQPTMTAAALATTFVRIPDYAPFRVSSFVRKLQLSGEMLSKLHRKTLSIP